MAAGQRTEPLLGHKDAGKLGLISFSPEGREPTKKERKCGIRKLDNKNTTSRNKGTVLKASNIPN